MEFVGLTGLALMVGVSALCIVGGYQAYFWPQNSPLRECRTGKVGRLDHLVKFTPEWVWIYSLLYYPFMLTPVLWIDNPSEFIWVCTSYFALLAAHVLISQLVPMKTPDEWRQYDKDKNVSTRFLAFIQSIDKGGNCFPSMHVAVATLTALHLTSYTGGESFVVISLVWLSVAAISLSAVFTKQHFVSDIVWGKIFALVVYFSFTALLPLELFEGWFV
ncbi:phosphatase PAP2 family protein [uncultured Sulfitobacter sp.]|uniref:phosphatase PAP2 family protein n=1 Tax=uncultured Sulfitobacter sp. TaxID=191468 RepID=UPI00262DEE19|nr:phosphatase PAP2 family protein [uncultured Sulfitobacter sp.]